jgi:superfamily II RNA helicase
MCVVFLRFSQLILMNCLLREHPAVSSVPLQVFNNAIQCLSEEDRALPPILKILPMLQASEVAV